MLRWRGTQVAKTTESSKQLYLGRKAGFQQANKTLRTLQHPENSLECTLLTHLPTGLVGSPHLRPTADSKSTTNPTSRKTPRKGDLRWSLFALRSPAFYIQVPDANYEDKNMHPKLPSLLQLVTTLPTVKQLDSTASSRQQTSIHRPSSPVELLGEHSGWHSHICQYQSNDSKSYDHD